MRSALKSHGSTYSALMDASYYLTAPAFVIGAASGVQGVFDRYKNEVFKAALTRWGILYLLTRGTVSAGAFCILYAHRYWGLEAWQYVVVSGLVTEGFLRSRFYFKGAGTSSELFKGGLDLLRFWQNLFLDRIGDRLGASRIVFVKGTLPVGVDFSTLCDIILKNKNAYDVEIRDRIEQVVGKIRLEFQKTQKRNVKIAELDETFRHQLSYELIIEVGRDVYRTVVSN